MPPVQQPFAKAGVAKRSEARANIVFFLIICRFPFFAKVLWTHRRDQISNLRISARGCGEACGVTDWRETGHIQKARGQLIAGLDIFVRARL